MTKDRAISLNAVKDILKKANMEEFDIVAYRNIMQLPPVTPNKEEMTIKYTEGYNAGFCHAQTIFQKEPKTGHWIEDEYEMEVRCSECGEENDECSKYERWLKERSEWMKIQTLINTEVLKPCPFCGKEVTLISTSQTKEFIFSHKGLRNCPFYQFKISWEVAKNLKEVKDLWNRRAESEE